tara:strand:- start:17 stop:253 length:237 start_codon:yes stop_codon:yes gene_type:complete
VNEKRGSVCSRFFCCSSSLNAAVRKASIVALGVFGSLTGVESQTHLGLAILMFCLVIHLAAAPYDLNMDRNGVSVVVR